MNSAVQDTGSLLTRRDALLTQPLVVPAGTAETRLARIWAQRLGVDRVGSHDDYFELGGMSVQAVEIFRDIEQGFGVRLPMASLYNAPTVAELAALVAAAPREQSSRAVTRDGRAVLLQQGASNRGALFIVPGVGGGVLGLSHLCRALGSGQTVYAFESRGLHAGESPLESLPGIAAEYLEDMQRVRPGGPCTLLGICWGGTVALEMAVQAEASGAALSATLLLDPPAWGGDKPPRPGPFGFIAARLRLYRQELRALPPRDRWDYLRQRAKNLLNVERHRELLRGDNPELRMQRVRAANAAALRAHRPAAAAGPTRLVFTRQRGAGTSRDGRGAWLALLGKTGPDAEVDGKDTGDAITPGFAAELAAVVRAELDRAG